MAKGRSVNPADAHRKAQKKKEQKKNKAERQKNRDFALVKTDTAELEDEIAELENLGDKASSVQRARLTEVKADLARIIAKKDTYVSEHPEQRGLVYRRRKDKEKQAEDGEKQGKLAQKARRLFHEHGPKKGLPRHPERSIYYDPVMNPFGVPPPGMPYAERPLLPGEIDSEAEENDIDANASDDSDDIPLPAGPPPGRQDGLGSNEDHKEDDEDDIPLPEGPPPSEQIISGHDPVPPPLPPSPPPLPLYNYQQILLQPSMLPPFPGSISPPFPMPLPVSGAPIWPPPPPPSMSLPYGAPPPPPGFFPRNRGAKNASAMQDPLSNAPHLTYQEHREIRQAGGLPPPPPSLPPRPGLPPRPATAEGASSGTSTSANATITAEPELRDFKKESTAFVPATLKRKKGASRVNAAPVVAAEDGMEGEDNKTEAKPDLLGALREKLGPMASAGTASGPTEEGPAKRRRVEGNTQRQQGNSDYDKFLSEMGDLLAPPNGR